MSAVAGTGPAGGAPLPPEHARLRDASGALEGVFVEQLFKAMRETVPEGGALDGGAGEELFTGLLDQHLAAGVPARWEGGLGEALYRQLRAGLPGEGRTEPPLTTGETG